MKKIVLTLLCTTSFLFAIGQDPIYDKLKNNGYKDIYAESRCPNNWVGNKIMVVTKNNKVGLMNKKEFTLSVPCVYDFMYQRGLPPCLYVAGTLGANKDTVQKIIINADNQVIIPTKFRSVSTKGDKLFIKSNNGKTAVYDQNGTLVLPECDSIKAWPSSGYYPSSFSNGYAVTYNAGKASILDTTGKIIVKGLDSIGTFYTNLLFYKSLCKVYKGGKAALMDKNGVLRTAYDYSNFILPCVGVNCPFYFPKRMGKAPKGENCMLTTKDNKFGMIDLQGKIIIPNDYDIIWKTFDEYGYTWAVKNQKAGFLSVDGKEITEFKYDNLNDFTEDMAAVAVNVNGTLLWGYIDRTGKEIVPCQYTQVDGFFNGMSAVYDNTKKGGYIDKTGKLIIPIIYTTTIDFNEDVALVKDGGYYGYIDKTGKVLSPFIYSKARSFHQGYAAVYNEKKQHWGYIDKSGKVVIPFVYDTAESFSESDALVEKDGKKFYIKADGKENKDVKYSPLYGRVPVDY
ncbi:MAG: WG repeat-containing protein [Bacteroidota bacterium]